MSTVVSMIIIRYTVTICNYMHQLFNFMNRWSFAKMTTVESEDLLLVCFALIVSECLTICMCFNKLMCVYMFKDTMDEWENELRQQA